MTSSLHFQRSGDGDASYVYVMLEHVIPLLEVFAPAVIFVACGFDALDDDPYVAALAFNTF